MNLGKIISMPDIVVEVKDLFKTYGNVKAVNGINFNIIKGEIFGVLGPNGAGKSTTPFGAILERLGRGGIYGDGSETG